MSMDSGPAAGGQPRFRLFCFPHAGGSAASFNGWSRRLPPEIALERVQFPGRALTAGERPHTTIDGMLPELWRVLAPLLDRPFALYGHSLGALVAYEFARHARALGLGEPEALFVSGRRAPQWPLSRPPLFDLPVPRLIAELTALGGMPDVLLKHRKWLGYLLPALRADLQMTDRYVHKAGEPLGCPLFAFRGAADSMVSEPQLDAWRAQTSGRFIMTTLPGRHFLASEGSERLIDIIVETLLGSSPLASDVPPDRAARPQLEP
jgi:medium-chain acyl-[acyl-carrier-protein] hydrolase